MSESIVYHCCWHHITGLFLLTLLSSFPPFLLPFLYLSLPLSFDYSLTHSLALNICTHLTLNRFVLFESRNQPAGKKQFNSHCSSADSIFLHLFFFLPTSAADSLTSTSAHFLIPIRDSPLFSISSFSLSVSLSLSRLLVFIVTSCFNLKLRISLCCVLRGPKGRM